MAYIKYKELTRYFNFNKKIEESDIPKYIFQYLDKGENILLAYKVRRDQIIITNKKIVIFDIRGFISDNRKIHILPYSSISSLAIEFKFSGVSLFIVMDSGYQLKINFVQLNAEAKTEIREVYTTVANTVMNKR